MPRHLPLVVDHASHLGEYVTLGATGIITEEAAPILGGFAAHNHHLHLGAVFLAIAIGTWVADILLYALGRWRGEWARTRWKKATRHIDRALRIVQRRPWRSSLAVRFAYGLRLTLPIACGAAKVTFPVYVVGSGISAGVWSWLFTLIGWGFGETAKLMLDHAKRYENVIGLIIFGALAIVFWYFHRREEQVEHVVEEVVIGDDRATRRAPDPS